MMTIGLILLLAGMVTIFLYMFIHSLNLSKNRLIIAFAVLGFAAGNFCTRDHFAQTIFAVFEC